MKPAKRTCNHADPRNYIHTTKGSLIITTCRICNGWIGNRPKEERR